MHSKQPHNILDAARIASKAALSKRERQMPFSNIPLLVHQTWKKTAADSWNPRILPWVELWLEDAIYVDRGPSMAYLFWDDTGMLVSLLWGLEADNDPESDAYWRQSYTYPQQLSQWAFAAAPQHPVFERYMDNLRNYTKNNEPTAQNSDPLKRTGPAAVTLATKSWLVDHVGFRWASLTGLKDGGKSKLVHDILILPITGFQPGGEIMPSRHGIVEAFQFRRGVWKDIDSE
uniref:Uncharacterized protein n=1 Tax=Fusarium oxysporum (strain Fo5176) TaxID=660025 RepID=A0A0D2YBD0_FUSOF